MRAPLLLAILLAVAGCGTPRAQLQLIADTRAAAIAAPQMADAAARAAVYEAVGRSVVAATEHLDGLPAPTWAPAVIVANPDPFIAATAISAADPPPAEPAPRVAAPPRDIVATLCAFAGTWLLYVATGGLGLCLLAFGLSFVPFCASWITPWAKQIEEAGLACAAGAALGLALRWLGLHSWIVYGIGAVVLAVYSLRCRSTWLPALRCLITWARHLTRTHATPIPEGQKS